MAEYLRKVLPFVFRFLLLRIEVGFLCFQPPNLRYPSPTQPPIPCPPMRCRLVGVVGPPPTSSYISAPNAGQRAPGPRPPPSPPDSHFGSFVALVKNFDAQYPPTPSPPPPADWIAPAVALRCQTSTPSAACSTARTVSALPCLTPCASRRSFKKLPMSSD